MHVSPSGRPLPAARDWWWVFDPRQSLRAQAVLLAGGGTFAFTVLLVVLAGTYQRRTLEQQVGPALETLAVQVGDKLDRAVADRSTLVTLAANLGPFAAGSPAELRRALEAARPGIPDCDWLGFVGPHGQVVAATGGLFERTDLSLRPWFRGGRERPYAGGPREVPALTRALPPAAGGETATHFLDFSAPVADVHGRAAGVLVAHVRWNWARDIVLSVVPETLARSGLAVTLYHPGGEVLLDTGASGWTQPLELPPLPEARKFRGAMRETPAGSAPYVTGYFRHRGIRDANGVGWLTTVRQTEARAYAPVAALQRTLAGWGLALCALVSAGTWAVAGRHARRLRAIGTAAERIHTGDRTALLPRPSGQGEVATMCAALGDLVEDLRNRPESK
ncbi:MAG: hypothetical protein B9S34_10470 [Opitutia bacterium Tous-C1TDCM]|nr:MAG: hypothetical protein B9S34_10470 [Opitutae bacterium Tous-C1TDCM]